jgi:predicted ATPase
MGLSESELLEIIKRRDYTPDQLQAIETAVKLYKKGFNVIPVNSEGRPVSTLLGVDTTRRLPDKKLVEGFIDAGFSGVAINNSSLPDNPGELLYVIRAKREALDKYKALNELVNNTVSWRRGEYVEALVVVDKSVSSKLLSKPVKREDIEIRPPSLLVVAGTGIELIRVFDYNSPTLGIREISEGELAGLLREIGVLSVEEAPKRVVYTNPRELEVALKELDSAAIETIKNILLEVYRAKPEYRNEVVYQFTYMAAYRLISPESIARVVKALLSEAGETQVGERVASMIMGLEKAGLDVKHYSSQIEEVLGVELDSVIDKPTVGVKKLEEVYEEVLGGEKALLLLGRLGEELETAEYPETGEEETEATLQDKLREVIERLPELIHEYCRLDLDKFTKSKRVEKKAACIYKLISSQFKIIKVPPRDASGESVVYAAVNNLLYDIEEIVKPIVGALIAREGARRNLVNEVITASYSTSTTIPWYKINPWEYLRLMNGVLDLETLRILDSIDYYFTYRLPVKIRQEEIDLVLADRYNIEDNPVYRYWRSRFDSDNWEYLVSSLGTWLAPFRSKHVAFLIGPPNSGKSTLLSNLTSPLFPIVAYASLRLMTGYTFGLEPLIGKQIVAYSERGETILKNLDIINNLFGEQDYIVVPRKHKPSITIRSLKAGFFAMNDPPIVYDYGGETMAAFLSRLSIIQIGLPENYKVIPNLTIPIREAFKFLLWARVQLERNKWVIKKMGEEELLDYLTRSTNSALQFLEESGEVGPDPSGRVKASELYEAYVKWSQERGLRPMGRNRFYSIVATKYPSYEREGVKWFRGLKLKVSGLIEASLEKYVA